MNRIYIYDNVMRPQDRRVFDDIGDVGDWLKKRYPNGWPKAWRLYIRSVADENLIQFRTLADEAAFREMRGDFHLMCWPEGPIVWAIIAIVIALVAIGLSFLLRPSAQAQQNNQQQSPNNSLSNRGNQDRPNQRIPDIGGTVNAVPDLICPPWREFINSQEVEICGMVIGVGSYTVRPELCFDDITPISEIAGASLAIYPPYNTPNSPTPTPQLVIGEPINRPLVIAQATSVVNGQTMIAPNNNNFVGDNNVYVGPDWIKSDGGVDFTDLFAAGDTIILTNGNCTTGSYVGDYSGTYLILSVTSDEIVLSDPAAVNALWGTIPVGDYSGYFSPTFYSTGVAAIGPFVLATDSMTEVWCNFVANNGMYKDDGTNQYATNVTIELIIQAIDGNNTPIGTAYFYYGTIEGSATIKTERAVTIKCILPNAGRCQIQARRISPEDTSFNGTVVDEVQWRDCYAISPMGVTDFGNVTTVQTLNYATEGALAQQSRKINMIVTRNVQQRKYVPAASLGGGLFRPASWTYTPGTDNMGPSDNAADIAMHFALDPYVGRRDISELDVDGIYALFQESQAAATTTLFDDTTPVTGGGISPTTGAVGGSFTAHYTDYIAVEPNAGLTIGEADAGSGGYGLAFYDTNKLFISGVAFPFAAGQVIITPASAAYMRFTVSTIDDSTQTVVQDVPELTAGAIETYFGTPLCCRFGYTFDDANTSFEEMFADISQATFCTAYRQGDLLSMFLEQATSDSVLLFNHRNKVPKSESRSYQFGAINGNDGIELDYINPDDPNFLNQDTTETLYFPVDQSATNPQKIKTVGVRNVVQATLLGWRYYNKIRYQWITLQVKTLREARLLLQNQRFICADDTRQDTIEGEVTNVVGLLLTLSQDVALLAGLQYTIFIQHANKTVEAIPITAGPDANQVILSYAPASAINIDVENEVRTLYQIAIPTDFLYFGDDNVLMDSDGNITCDDFDFSDVVPGDKVQLINAIVVDPEGHSPTLDLSGTYVVDTVTAPHGVKLVDPGAVNADWDGLTDYTHDISPFMSPTLIFTNPNAKAPTAFLCTDKTPEENAVYTVKAVNYDSRYYQNDNDYKAGLFPPSTTYPGNPYPPTSGSGGSSHGTPSTSSGSHGSSGSDHSISVSSH